MVPKRFQLLTHFKGSQRDAETSGGHNASQSGQSVSLRVNKRFEYDHNFRLLRVFQDVNGNIGPMPVATGEIQLSRLHYNEIDQLRRKQLHARDGSDFLQAINYQYHVRGWLH